MASLEKSTKSLKRIYHKLYTVSFRKKEMEFSISFYKVCVTLISKIKALKTSRT